MGIIALIIIFVCLCVDHMVTANMSGMNMDLKTKSIFSIKAALFFTFGYIFSMIFFRPYFVPANNWIAFAFLMLLGIKFMLETIEKSPSFKENENTDSRKLWRVACLAGWQFWLIGYPLELMGKSWFPQVLFLVIITFLMTILGFHLGSKSSKTILSKKLEFIVGIILIIMSVRLILV